MRVLIKGSVSLDSVYTLASITGFTFLVLNVNLFPIVNCSNGELYSSTAQLQKLVTIENEIIIDAVHDYIASLERRLQLAKVYLKDQHDFLISDNKKMRKVTHLNDKSTKPAALKDRKLSSWGKTHKLTVPEAVSSDPLRTFRLIRRFVQDLPKFEKDLRNDYERKFLRIGEKVRKELSFPSQLDLNAATEGLLRVQDAYNLDVNEFTQGIFEDISTNSSLDAADCFLIGTYALNANIYTRAIEWLERSFSLVTGKDDKSISKDEVLERLEGAILQHNKAWHSSSASNPYVYQETVERTRGDRKSNKRRTRVLDKQSHKLYETKPSFMDLINFAALCRGEQLQTAKAQKSLKCWYAKHTPQYMLQKIKLEVLHENPPVFQIHDVLSDSLIQDIQRYSQSSLSRSKVHGKTTEGHKIVSASRTSTSTWIRNPGVVAKLSNIYHKLQPVLQLNLGAKDACEDFQVTSYGITGHYNPHQDNILTSEHASGMSPEELKKGDRIATLMFYLSDVVKGGMSAFPRIGVAAKPVKGSALFWFNMKRNGDADPLSLHGGCPILLGQKWIANQWIRSNSQMFTRKCGLSRETF